MPTTAPQSGAASDRDTTRPHGEAGPRCVVVGDHELARRLEAIDRPAAPRVTVVSSFLAALGELAHDPADVVVGPLDKMAGMIHATGSALRRLAPRASLVVTRCPDDGPAATEAAERAGFEVVASCDEAVAAVTRWLGEHGAASPHGVTATADELRESDAARAAGEAAKASPPVEPPGDQLGDVDLIDALLTRGHAALVAHVLRLVRAQSGIADLAYDDNPDASVEGRASAEVRYHEQRLGVLHAPPPATGDALAAWAEWLGRWLALADRFDRFHHLCLRDELTGVWNRRHFNRFFADVLDRAAAERRAVTLMVFDIDDFKDYNDRFGHPAGDEILREAARLMQDSVRDHDVVARIGGDEFAVIFWDNDQAPRRPNSQHPHDVLKAARRFQQAVYAHKFPKLLDHAPGTLTISGGLASFPWDGRTPEELVTHADAMALESKRQGKNAITFGPAALGHAEDA